MGDLLFALNKEMISGKDHDLSGFGLAAGEWTKCTIDVYDNQMSISINNQAVFQYPLVSDIGMIGGVQWTFEGQGEIRQLEMKDQQGSLNLLKPLPRQ